MNRTAITATIFEAFTDAGFAHPARWQSVAGPSGSCRVQPRRGVELVGNDGGVIVADLVYEVETVGLCRDIRNGDELTILDADGHALECARVQRVIGNTGTRTTCQMEAMP